MKELVKTMHVLHQYDKRNERLDYALKRFPLGHNHLDVWVLMDKEGDNHSVELVNCDGPYITLLNVEESYKTGVLLEIPHKDHNLDMLSFFVASQEYSQVAKMYIELLESVVSGMADETTKELITKRLAEKV